MLDNHCINSNEQIAQVGEEEEPISAYDFVYLPIDFKWAFINTYKYQALCNVVYVIIARTALSS